MNIEYKELDKARRSLLQKRHFVDEKSRQLSLVAELAALVAAFQMIVLYEQELPSVCLPSRTDHSGPYCAEVSLLRAGKLPPLPRRAAGVLGRVVPRRLRGRHLRDVHRRAAQLPHPAEIDGRGRHPLAPDPQGAGAGAGAGQQPVLAPRRQQGRRHPGQGGRDAILVSAPCVHFRAALRALPRRRLLSRGGAHQPLSCPRRTGGTTATGSLCASCAPSPSLVPDPQTPPDD